MWQVDASAWQVLQTFAAMVSRLMGFSGTSVVGVGNACVEARV
jgi:hypothetical protein